MLMIELADPGLINLSFRLIADRLVLAAAKLHAIEALQPCIDEFVPDLRHNALLAAFAGLGTILPGEIDPFDVVAILRSLADRAGNKR